MKKILLLQLLLLLGLGSANAQFINEGWQTKTALPAARWGIGSCGYQQAGVGMHAVIGGVDAAGALTSTNNVYNSSTATWGPALAAPSTIRYQTAPMYLNGKIYYMGGYTGGFVPTNSVNIYDIVTNTWTTGAAMPMAVGDHGCVVNGSYIYVICGYNGSTPVTNVQVYNTITNTWAAGTPSPVAAYGGRAGIAKGKIVFTCGAGIGNVILSSARMGTIDPTNPLLITWTALPNYPAGTMYRPAAGSVNSPLATTVYFTGGDPLATGVASNATWGYDVVDNQWKSGPSKPTAVTNVVSLAPIVHNDTLFMGVAGGLNGVAQTAHEWLKIGRASGIPTTIAGTATKCFNTIDTLNAISLDTNLRWQASTDNVTFSFIPGFQGSNDTLFTSNLTVNTYFRVVSYGFVDSAISPSFLVTIIDTVSITTQPTPQSICAGSGTTFTVAATGAGLNYAWRKDGALLNNVAPFSGVNTNTLTISNVAGQQGIYDVVVTGTCNVKTSNGTQLTVNALPTQTLTSADALVCDGASTDITITFTGTAPYDFTYFDGTAPVNITSHPNNTFTYTVTPATQTTYYVSSIVDDNGCSAVAAGLMSTVTVDAKTSPGITVQPVDANVCSGASTTISATVTGDINTYTWYNGNTALTNGPQYTINNNTLTINNTAGMNGLEFHLVLDGDCGSPLHSDTVEIIETNTNTWDGSDNTLWSDADNWSCGAVPIITTDVIIPSGPVNMPEIDITSAICNSINMAAGTTLSYIGVNNALEVKAGITDNDGMDGTDGKLILSGTVAQTIPGTTYKDLTITGGSIKTPDGDLTVTGILNLGGGNIVLGNNDLTLGQPVAQAGGSPTSFIVTNGTGKVIGSNMGVGGNPDAVTFHIGTSGTSYTPIILENLGDVDTFTVSVIENVYVDGTGTNPAQVTNPVVDRTWMVDENTAGGSIVNMTPMWNSPVDEVNGFVQTHVYVAHYWNGEWISYVDSANGAPAAVAGAFPNMWQTTQDSIENFSPFTVASSGQFPLSIRLSNITAANAGPRNKVEWKSATEDAGDTYELESSTDAKSFRKIATIAANGKPSSYLQWDANPAQGVNYYRVKLVDASGKYSYSKVVSATVNSTNNFAIEAYPNPVRSTVSVKVNGVVTGKASVVVTDVTGKVVTTSVLVENNGAELNVSHLANGMYLLNYTDDVRNESIKINKQ